MTSSIVDYTTLINVKEKLKDVVTLDDRTREQCTVCAGNIYDIEDAPILPRHPRCRCVLVAYIDVDTLAKGFDREEVADTIIENKEKINYNKNVIISPGIHGALNDNNDPYQINRDKHAEKYYNYVRNRDKKKEILTIAINTGFRIEDIEKIYNHIFINEYNLVNDFKRFDPDYNMAESWRRLREGKNIQNHDFVMLEHEFFEYTLMKQGYNYRQAHDLTNEIYNYYEALKKWKKERGDL
ncbi:hypothetical protein KMP11_02940 [Gemella sp. zg-570]|uniref:hypothetical protein n=1 Tax=Gemella sp. zg-570 TaxID=2840371 RepID=UPI001C0E468E|nr:hypothetical protein [Gemella sp. zg-570]QWQ39297.1 hypothetical protein KMP11_02940 [Gemella sp. zg-570]